MRKKNVKIGIVGLWHLGCVLCAAWSKMGFEVIGFDYSKDLIDRLDQNQPPIFEPKLATTLASSRGKGNLKFTNEIIELRQCDFVFLAYDTPVLDNDESDLTPLQKAINDLGNILKAKTVIVVSSQTPVGTCHKFRADVQKKNSAIELVYSPENLRLGEAIECYLKPGRIIIGAESEKAGAISSGLFSKIKAEILMMDLTSAEMVKHAINAFLANSIVFTNQLADLCEVAGANILEVIRGMKTDERIGPKAYLSPGIGFSGGTLGRDLRILSKLNKTSGKKSFLFELVQNLNYERKNLIVDKVARLLNGELSNKIIAVLGITYKPGTSTLRRSLPLEIVRLLLKQGAQVKVYDPKANYDELGESLPFKVCRSVDEALSGSQLILLLTEWAEFKDYDWVSRVALIKRKIIFDTKNFLYHLELAQKGYCYHGIGLKNE